MPPVVGVRIFSGTTQCQEFNIISAGDKKHFCSCLWWKTKIITRLAAIDFCTYIQEKVIQEFFFTPK